MFNVNDFKKQVKEWMRSHQDASVQELIDFCEENIPAQHFAANKWLVDQTVSWYSHILKSRESFGKAQAFD